jgi:hypothetical protein
MMRSRPLRSSFLAAGHAVMYDRPREFEATLLEFRGGR